MSMRSLLAAAAALVILAGPATAETVKVGSLEISQMWARATPPKAPTGAGFLTITNTGTQPDRLIAASTPFAEQTQIHEMKVKNNVMTMHEVEGGLVIPPGKTVTLAPGGYHLMFMSLIEDFKQGGEVPVTLIFDKAGSVDITLNILPVGSPGPAGAATGNGGGMKSMDNMKMGQ